MFKGDYAINVEIIFRKISKNELKKYGSHFAKQIATQKLKPKDNRKHKIYAEWVL